MKRLVKHFNRKGFTLVETLLATFILVVVSTMLVNGFIATMGYSYQTSVYTKSGSNNYTACMSTLANWCATPNLGDTGREAQAKDLCSGDYDNATELVFDNPIANTYIENLYVSIHEEISLDPTVPGSLPYGDGRFSPDPGYDDLADNRKTFVYFPQYWAKTPEDEDTLGNIVVMYDADAEKYYWVVNSTDFTSYTKVTGSTAIGET